MANISTTTDLVINRLSKAKYDQLCAAGQLDEYQLYITDEDAAGELSSQIDALYATVSAKADLSSVEENFQPKGNYLSSSALDDYKTYDATLSSLSNDGYALYSQVSSKAETSALNAKITIDDRISGITEQTDLSIIRLSATEYSQLVQNNELLSNALYIVENSYEDAQNKQIKNVALPTDQTDAATKGYVDSELSSRIPTKTSQLSNDSGFLTEHQSLSGYYTKSETSSASEISDALTSFYQKSETSSASEISAALSDAVNDAAEAVVPAVFRTIQLAKPQQADGYRLHFRGDIARDDQFEDIVISGFDSASQERWQFFKRFSPLGLSGKWQTMLSNGFYVDADNVPVSFSFADALSSIDEFPSISSQYFLRYFWYYELSGVEYKSDQFSIAVPSNTAVGANMGDVVHKAEFYELQQNVIPQSQAVEVDDLDFNLVYSTKYNIIQSPVEDGTKIALVRYSEHKTYKIDLSTASSEDVELAYYIGLANGNIEWSDVLNSEQHVFDRGKHYYIEIADEKIFVYDGDTIYAQQKGSDIQISAALQSGTPIAQISVDGASTTLYAPDSTNVQVSAVLSAGTQIASISVDGTATAIYAPADRYQLVTAELSSVDNSLCCFIQDRTITTLEISSSATPVVVVLPEKLDDGARDFIVRIEVSSSTAPSFTFAGLDETIAFDSEQDDWMIVEPGLNLISFTETK